MENLPNNDIIVTDHNKPSSQEFVFRSSAYFQHLRQYSKRGWISILQYISGGNCPKICSNDSGVFAKRANRPSLRIFLSRTCFLLANHRISKKYDLLLSLPEIFNIGTYEANVALDKKDYSLAHESDQANLIRSHLWHGMVFDIISKSSFLPERTLMQMIDYYGTCYQNVYQGQDLDAFDLIFSKADTLSEPSFHEIYLRRCNLIGASTIKPCLLSAILQTPDLPFAPSLEQVLHKIGVAGQMINDLSDCLIRIPLVKHKINFADLRNRKLTLPYFYLSRLGYDLEAILKQTSEQDSAPDLIVKIFAKEKLHEVVLDLIKNQVHKGLEDDLEHIRALCHPQAFELLKGVATMPYNSKIVRILGTT